MRTSCAFVSTYVEAEEKSTPQEQIRANRDALMDALYYAHVKLVKFLRRDGIGLDELLHYAIHGPYIETYTEKPVMFIDVRFSPREIDR